MKKKLISICKNANIVLQKKLNNKIKKKVLLKFSKLIKKN